jgi:hypothetical protein
MLKFIQAVHEWCGSDRMFFDEDDVFAVFRDLVTALYKLHDSLKLVLDILPAIA